MAELKNLKPNPTNPRIITGEQFIRLKKKIKRNPDGLMVHKILHKDGIILAGNQRFRALNELGLELNPDWFYDAEKWTHDQIREYIFISNVSDGNWDWEELANETWATKEELDEWGVDTTHIDEWDKEEKEGEANAKLTEKFIVPPFSLLDTRQGYWQDRKRTWLAIGIQSELGRDDVGSITDNAQSGLNKIAGANFDTGTSVFDPVLCEISYNWFNIKGGSVLDPFAGGSVRGVVADKLGYKYTGIELSGRQVDANRLQAKQIGVNPTWISGDSNVELDKLDGQYDMVFSCPPYEDLEVYSDDPADISNMSHDDFNAIYKNIIGKAVGKLKDDSFIVWVVGEVRNKKGFYNLLIPNTIKFFEDAGAKFYNDVILVNTAGTLPIRITKAFQSGRKIGKMHQNVLVFYKGDPKNIKKKFSHVEVAQPDNK